MELVIHASKQFASGRLSKLLEAGQLMKKVIESVQFEDELMKMKLIETEELTPQGVALRLRSRKAELWVSLFTPWFWRKWSVVGYTYPNVKTQYINKYYFDRFTVAQIAGNLAHEWCHKLGFGHSFKPTPSRPMSVPYAVGSLVTRLASGGADKLTPEQTVG